jgi:ribosomal protein S18 acetylase RimI-like enzyme
MEISIRPFDFQKDREEVYRLHASAFGEESLVSWKNRWKWQYEESPAARQMGPNMWVAEREDGRLVGYQGSTPSRLKIGDRIIPTYDPGDLAVDVAARRQGLGQKLTKAYMDQEQFITMGYNWVPATGRIFLRLGLTPVPCVPIHMRPLDLKSIYHFLQDTGHLPDLLSGSLLKSLFSFGMGSLGIFLTSINRLKSPRKSPRYEVEQITQVGSEFDALWRELAPRFPIMFVRDADFVRWRFLEDPGYKHTLLAARSSEGKLEGYIDILVSKRQGLKMGRIMDLFCSFEHADITDTLLANAIDVFREYGAATITCQGLHPQLRSRIQPYFYLTPKRYQNPGLLYWKGDPELAPFLQEPTNWHLTHADGDQGFFSA